MMRNTKETIYCIEGLDSDGMWNRDNVEGGHGSDVNTFAAEAEAAEMIPILAKTFECPENTLRVAEVEDD